MTTAVVIVAAWFALSFGIVWLLARPVRNPDVYEYDYAEFDTDLSGAA